MPPKKSSGNQTVQTERQAREEKLAHKNARTSRGRDSFFKPAGSRQSKRQDLIEDRLRVAKPPKRLEKGTELPARANTMKI